MAETVFDSPIDPNITRHYSGRDWILNAIDTWLTSGEEKFFYVLGEPGTGKSTISARLKEISDGKIDLDLSYVKKDFLISSYFCTFDYSMSLEVNCFLKTIHKQLSLNLPDFNLYTIDKLSKNNNYQINNNNIFSFSTIHNIVNVELQSMYSRSSLLGFYEDYILEPLRSIYSDNSNGKIVFLIDAINESLDFKNAISISELLHSVIYPDNIRFIVTSQTDEKIYNNFIKTNNNSNFYILNISDDKYLNNNYNDIVAFIKKQLDANDIVYDINIVNEIVNHCSCNFLFCDLIIKQILERENKSIHEILKEHPTNLNDYYNKLLQRITKSDSNLWTELYRPILGVICVSKEPLNRKQLSRFTGISVEILSDALITLNTLLVSIESNKY